jgi:4-hydroxy-2-oxoheptanedioate aldolase
MNDEGDLEHSTLTLEATAQNLPGGVELGRDANGPRSRQHVGLYSARPGRRRARHHCPGVRSAEEACAVVAASKFAPLGERGAGAALPQLEFRSFPAAEASAAVNDATVVIVQFESAEAIDKAEEIASDVMGGVISGLRLFQFRRIQAAIRSSD